MLDKSRIHIALAVENLQESIADYSQRLGVTPSWIATNKYALFRTDTLNLSLSVNPAKAGQLRHLGFENDTITDYSQEQDVNGIKWEYFNKQQQEQEILEFYPEAVKYK
jgi:hypothetical protein